MLNKKVSPYSSVFSSRKIVKAEYIYRPDGETLWSEIQKKQEIINNTQNDNQLLRVRINQLENQVKAYECTILENDRQKKFQRFIQDGEYKTGQETLVINLRRDLHEKDKQISKLTENLNQLKKQAKATKIQELELQQQYYINHVADLNELLNSEKARKKTLRKQTWQKVQSKIISENIEQHAPNKKLETEGIVKRKRHYTQSNFKSSTEEVKILRKTSLTEDNRQVKTEKNDYASFQKELILCVQKSKENLLLVEKQDDICKLQKQIFQQEEQLNNLTRLIEKCKQENKSFEQSIIRGQQTIQIEKNLVNQLSQDIITLKQNNDLTNQQVQNLMNDNRLLQETIQQLTLNKKDEQENKSELEILQQSIKRLNQDINQEKDKNMELKKENEELKKNNQSLSETISQLVQTLKEQENQNNQKSKENLLLIEKQDEICKLQNQSLQQEEQINNLTRLVEKCKQEKKSFEQSIIRNQQTIQMEQNLVNQLSQEIITLKQNNDLNNQQVQNLMNDNRLLQETIQQLTLNKKDEQENKSELEILQQSIKRLDQDLNQEKDKNMKLKKENEELKKNNQSFSETISQLVQTLKEQENQNNQIKIQFQHEIELRNEQQLQNNINMENALDKIKEENARLTEELKLHEEKNEWLHIQLKNEENIQKTHYENEYKHNIQFFQEQTKQQSDELENFALLFKQQNEDHKELMNNYIQLQQQNEDLKSQLDFTIMRIQYFENQESEITLYVRGQQNQPRKQINVKLRYTINDLFQHLKFVGFHQLSPQNVVCHIPILRIRYASTEWNKKIIDLVTVNEIEMGMEIEFLEI